MIDAMVKIPHVGNFSEGVDQPGLSPDVEYYVHVGYWELQHQARNESSKRLSPDGYMWTGIFLSTIAVLSILANFTVITVLVKNPLLRSPVNLMLLNLTVSKFRRHCNAMQ